jgi:excisionase family DNA binding protein
MPVRDNAPVRDHSGGRRLLRGVVFDCCGGVHGDSPLIVQEARISSMDLEHAESLKELKEALQAHHQALENLESALLEFEQSISGEATLRSQEQQGAGMQLLSIPQLCQELGMGKSWIYRRLRSGEIPSIRLGRTIKVRRDELEQYLQRHRYPAVQEEHKEKSSF